MSGMNALLWFGGIVLIFAGIVAFELAHFGDLATSNGAPTPPYTLTLDGATVHVILAQTPADQERGLSGRDSLAADEGMLFVFPKDGTYSFWMKNMKFSIDIIWLSVEGRVVDIAANLSPGTYPRSFAPQRPSRFVLEVPAGFVEAHRVQIGDSAQLP